jgi:S-disulfanyl-L-cysteine oxidoreductase SoxD
MFSCRELTLALVLLAAGATVAQPDRFPGIGRAATAKEVAAWDIDVRPDFKGLPAGAGSVAKGMQVWESQCASCHGVFGESNQFFSPIVGGTNQDDIKTGRVARLTDPSFPGRTTLMKLPTVSALWDYINRAMPWTQPKSLSTEEVYAVTAYILNLGGVVPDSFVLSDQNIAEVQQRLPNRNGMSTDHALWPGAAQRQPDVRATACMKDCVKQTRLASFIPDFARDAHGNLAEQNRTVGAQKGADTRRPAVVALVPADAALAAVALVQKHACVACHGMESRTVGPGFRDVSRKYASTADAVPYLTAKIKAGGSGVWGEITMPSQPLGEADAQVIAQWLVRGMKP